MPYYLFIYSPSDFTTALPSETIWGGMSGSLPVTLTLRPDATPTRVAVTDDDANFDEIDLSQQVLTEAIVLDGTAYAAGTTVHSAYDLYNPGDSLRVITLHFGGNGFLTFGAVHGLVATQPLEAGQSYTFTQTTTSNSTPIPYDQIACFAAGTRIATVKGEVAVEDLRAGIQIATRDHGFQSLRAVLSTTVPARGAFAPVVLAAGSCGNLRDLVVSPQHRMLIGNARADLLFSEPEVLVAATHLAAAGLGRRREGGEVTYFHLVFDRHEIIFAEGAPTESFLLRDIAALPAGARAEFDALFPAQAARRGKNATTQDGTFTQDQPRTYAPQAAQTARLCLRAHEAALLLAA
ncbi:Hint domain-containing protein [Pseudogemmobacter sonorensis]|uniref:Hint domain-containing protein n=1 Tax=Pseudogemmobacter sonorensis TaxID=2989681 RepID=UPI0036A19C21